MARRLGQAYGKYYQAVGENNFRYEPGGGNNQLVLLQETSSINVLGEFYRQLPMVLKDTRFEENLKHMSVRKGKLHFEIHYKYMLVVRQIY